MVVVDISIMNPSDSGASEMVVFNNHVFVKLRQHKCPNKLAGLTLYNCLVTIRNYNVKKHKFFWLGLFVGFI
jgi:uncharacterized membrane protein YozB (DUF420 family)